MIHDDTFTMLQYRVVRLDAKAGTTSVLHETYNLADARAYFSAAQAGMGKAGVSIRLIARPEPGWFAVEG